MMHRIGSGQKIEDIEAARREWFAAGRTVSTYPNKGEWDAWEEDFGKLVMAADDGHEVRQGATIKSVTRGGTRKIIHNCVIDGNPEAFARWEANPSEDKGWYPRWTYRPARKLQLALDYVREGIRPRPVSIKVIETGVPLELP